MDHLYLKVGYYKNKCNRTNDPIKINRFFTEKLRKPYARNVIVKGIVEKKELSTTQSDTRSNKLTVLSVQTKFFSFHSR